MEIMKKYISSTLLLLLGLMVFTACSKSDDDYQWASVSGDQVYFSSKLKSKIDLSKSETSFSVPLARVKTDAAITVNLSLTDASGLFTAPASVTFAEGSKEAVVNISYDPAKLEYDKYLDLKLAITDAAYTTAYGKSEYSFKVGAPSPYQSIGKGKFHDDFFMAKTYEVEILQNQEDPTVYRIMHPYDAAIKAEDIDASFSVDGSQAEYLQIKLMKVGDVLGGVTLTMDNLVYFEPTMTGCVYDELASQIMLTHGSEFSSLSTEDIYSHTRILDFQEDGSIGRIQLAPRYHLVQDGRGWGYQATDGMIYIDFPGYAPKDYALSVSYLGGFFNNAGENFASVNITMGADIEEVKYALVAGGNVDGTVDGIIDGTIASESVTESGNINIKNTFTGYCTLVAVAFAGGEAQVSAYAKFYTEQGGPQWTSLGKGLYTEECLMDYYGNDAYFADPLTYEVEIQENTNKPGLYRLVEPYGSAFPYNEEGDWDATQNWYVIVDATDPNGVFIPEQRTGLDWGDGEFSIQSMGSYYMDGGYDFATVKSAGLMGTLAGGVITFPDKGLLCILANDAIYGNENGLTKIVLPNAVPASARKFARANSVKKGFVRTHNAHAAKVNTKVLGHLDNKAVLR